MLDKIQSSFEADFLPTNQYNALTLAYIGDGVYEMFVRTYLIRKTDAKVNILHKRATTLVCAKAQAEFFRKIEGLLTEEELAAFHRGRNTKSNVPKNAQVSDYRIATGVETLLGHLYMNRETERISELMSYLFK